MMIWAEGFGSRVVVGLAAWLCVVSTSLAQPAQESYASPEEATVALVAAARSHDRGALRALFGTDSEQLLQSGDPYAENEQLRRFVEAYEEKHALVPQGTGRMQLDVGQQDWPLPIPIVQMGGRWHFDTLAGAQEIIDRRIGRNELAAIRVSLAYVEAQKDYFAHMQRRTGTGFYAQRLISTPGHEDGLYWPAVDGAPESPFGPLVAQALEEGYPGERVGNRPIPYQGYYYRILTGQGPNASEGLRNYLQSGKLTGGFALIAWPARHGASGIFSFEVNQDGVVFQKDLGPDTPRAVAGITRFDPDLTWARVEVTKE